MRHRTLKALKLTCATSVQPNRPIKFMPAVGCVFWPSHEPIGFVYLCSRTHYSYLLLLFD